MFQFKRTWGPAPKYPNVLSYPNKNKFTVIGGPCSVESEIQIHSLAKKVKMAGATHLRGGVFRAGTFPGKEFGYKFELLQHFHSAAVSAGLPNIVEVLDYNDYVLDAVCEYADCLQIGSRGMQHYSLLHQVASKKKPVFLKRNQGSTLDEWLGAAEHLLSAGCEELYLIERGSSTFENHVRWSLSVSMIAAAKKLTNIPIIVDAAHGSGRSDLVEPLTLAGVAAGADGLLCEVHESPEKSLSDPDQAITPQDFFKLMSKVDLIREAR